MLIDGDMMIYDILSDDVILVYPDDDDDDDEEEEEEDDDDDDDRRRSDRNPDLAAIMLWRHACSGMVLSWGNQAAWPYSKLGCRQSSFILKPSFNSRFGDLMNKLDIL